MPCLRRTSAVFAPASCSCRIPTICSSVNRPRFIVRTPFQGRTLTSKSEEIQGLRSALLCYATRRRAPGGERQFGFARTRCRAFPDSVRQQAHSRPEPLKRMSRIVVGWVELDSNPVFSYGVSGSAVNRLGVGQPLVSQ